MPTRVSKAIEAHYDDLSAQQRRTADYLLGHHRTAFALSVSELAGAAEVSEATVVRFSREIGYGGYHQLRAALMEEAQEDLAPVDRFSLEKPSEEPASTVLEVAAQEVANVNRTIEAVDPESFGRVVQALGESEMVGSLGLGVSALLARLAAYELTQIGVRAHCLSPELMSLVEQVELLPAGTAVLIFGFPPYSRETVAAAARAHKRGLDVFAITDAPTSPLRSHARAMLIAKSENLLFTNSLSGTMVLINALVTEIALANRPRALKQLELSRAAYDESGWSGDKGS